MVPQGKSRIEGGLLIIGAACFFVWAIHDTNLLKSVYHFVIAWVMGVVGLCRLVGSKDKGAL
jgi:hypothetical protein